MFAEAPVSGTSQNPASSLGPAANSGEYLHVDIFYRSIGRGTPVRLAVPAFPAGDDLRQALSSPGRVPLDIQLWIGRYRPQNLVNIPSTCEKD